jgi:hypothetical protein
LVHVISPSLLSFLIDSLGDSAEILRKYFEKDVGTIWGDREFFLIILYFELKQNIYYIVFEITTSEFVQ